MKKVLLVCALTVVTGYSAFSQNVGINATGAAPDASAILDVSSSTQGLLAPRVALTSTTVSAPIVGTPLTSLLVYNTATAGTSPNNVIPGYYYWNGTIWVSFSTASNNAWTVSGNSGLTAANFLGTNDAVDLVFKTNATEVMRVYSGGGLEISAGVGVGTASKSAVYAVGTYNNYLELNVQNLSNGNLASSDIVATANNGTGLSVYIDMGINSQGYSNAATNILNGPNLAYLYANGEDFKIGNGSPNKHLIFFTNPSGGVLGTNTANGLERMRISENGNVGIGVQNPGSLLHVGGVASKPGGGTWTAASDKRLKKDVKPFLDGLRVLASINPVWFKYNGLGGQPNDGKNYVGIIAQDLQKFAPYTISTFKDPETDTEYLNYDSNAITYVLINSVKEQQAEIIALKKQLEEQNQRLLRLEQKLK